VWLQPSKSTHSLFGARSSITRTTSGRTSSNSPEMSSSGTSISPRRSTIVHSRSGPMTVNSLGPFIVP
jgi:hypothetical protein